MRATLRHNGLAMRKLAAIVILLVLPLQLAFAAAAEYCDLGHGACAQHFGHHVHNDDGNKAGTAADKPGCDGHCGYCQLACTQAQACEFHWSATPAVFVPHVAEPVFPACNDPPSIDRPPRHAHA
jgi:hypothetical protein